MHSWVNTNKIRTEHCHTQSNSSVSPEGHCLKPVLTHPSWAGATGLPLAHLLHMSWSGIGQCGGLCPASSTQMMLEDASVV